MTSGRLATSNVNVTLSLYFSVVLYVTVPTRSVAEGGYLRRTVTDTAMGPVPGDAVVPMGTMS